MTEHHGPIHPGVWEKLNPHNRFGRKPGVCPQCGRTLERSGQPPTMHNYPSIREWPPARCSYRVICSCGFRGLEWYNLVPLGKVRETCPICGGGLDFRGATKEGDIIFYFPLICPKGCWKSKGRSPSQELRMVFDDISETVDSTSLKSYASGPLHPRVAEAIGLTRRNTIERIIVCRAEGPTPLCGTWEFTGHDALKDANLKLREISRTAPKDGGYDKTDVTIYSKNDTIVSRHDITYLNTDGSVLQHAIRMINALMKRTKNWNIGKMDEKEAERGERILEWLQSLPDDSTNFYSAGPLHPSIITALGLSEDKTNYPKAHIRVDVSKRPSSCLKCKKTIRAGSIRWKSIVRYRYHGRLSHKYYHIKCAVNAVRYRAKYLTDEDIWLLKQSTIWDDVKHFIGKKKYAAEGPLHPSIWDTFYPPGPRLKWDMEEIQSEVEGDNIQCLQQLIEKEPDFEKFLLHHYHATSIDDVWNDHDIDNECEEILDIYYNHNPYRPLTPGHGHIILDTGDDYVQRWSILNVTIDRRARIPDDETIRYKIIDELASEVETETDAACVHQLYNVDKDFANFIRKKYGIGISKDLWSNDDVSNDMDNNCSDILEEYYHGLEKTLPPGHGFIVFNNSGEYERRWMIISIDWSPAEKTAYAAGPLHPAVLDRALAPVRINWEIYYELHELTEEACAITLSEVDEGFEHYLVKTTGTKDIAEYKDDPYSFVPGPRTVLYSYFEELEKKLPSGESYIILDAADTDRCDYFILHVWTERRPTLKWSER